MSLLVHVLVLLFLLTPFAVSHESLPMPLGAGGPGPAGGGGGGRHGTGGEMVPEELRYAVATPTPPPPPATTVMPKPAIVPPATPPKLVETAPTPPLVPHVKIDVPAPTVDVAVVPGLGGGTGNDGTNGNGPGTGGGVGTGVGPGRGSGKGPGTGGGPGDIYPATPEELILPPMPIPGRLKGKAVDVRFSLDSLGNVKSVEFTPTGDGGFDRQLRDRLREHRFRPAHRMDGTPIASIFPYTLSLY